MKKEMEIDELIKLLDGQVEAGVGRIKLDVVESDQEGKLEEHKEMGRCDFCTPEQLDLEAAMDEE